MSREPDPWASCPHEEYARRSPYMCDHCGEETYDPEEVFNGDLLCQPCAEKFHNQRSKRRGAK